MKKIIALLIMALLLCGLCTMTAFAEDNISSTNEYGVLTISGSGVIPEMAFINCNDFYAVIIGEDITGIGNCAFYGCKNIKTVSLPNKLKSIGDYAFGWCTALKEINIPNGVNNIGNYAFKKCISLSKIKIPSSVSSIGEGAFEFCSNLTATLHCTNNTTLGRTPFNEIAYLNVILPDGWNGDYSFFRGNSITYFIETSCLDAGPDAYIDTGVLPTENIHAILDVEVNNEEAALFGSYWLNYGHCCCHINSRGDVFGTGFGKDCMAWSEDAPVLPGRHSIELDKGTFKYDGDVKRINNYSEFPRTIFPIYLLAINLYGNTQTFPNQKIRFYSCKIYDGDNLVRDFIPVIFKNEAGIYDLQECKFYPKQGNGSMTIPTNPNASTISEGNTWIIAGIAVVAVVTIAVIVAKKKKKIIE